MLLSSHRNSVVVLLFSLLIPTQSLAYSFIPEFGVEVKEESNVTKDTRELDDTITAPFLGLYFNETNPTINTRIDFFATYEDYKDDTFDSQDLYDVNAFLDWTISPERLVWAFEDYARTQRVNIRDPDVPNNLQTVNVFSTGPDLIFQHEVWTLLTKLRYGDSHFTESDADSTFYTVTGAVRRELNEYSRATGALAFRTNDYDAEFRDDYDIYKAYISYSRDLPTGDFLTDFGYNRVEFDEGDLEEEEPYFRLLMNMQPVGSITLDINLIDELTDAAGQAYSATESRVIDETEDQFTPLVDFTTIGIYRSKYGSLGLRYAAGGLLTWGLSGSYADKDYVDTRADSTEATGRVFATLQLTQLFSFHLGGSYQEVDFDETDIAPALTDEITRGFAAFNYRITDNISSRLGYSTEERTSTDNTRDFTDDIVFFSLKYRRAVK